MKDFKKLSMYDENIETTASDSTTPLLGLDNVSERFFSCECAGEGLLLTQDKEDKDIYFALYGHGVGYKPKPSIWERIKYAWYHMKTGKKYADCIVMRYDKAKEAGEWLIANAR